jgi:uncharacterized protein (TIGR03083 family)
MRAMDKPQIWPTIHAERAALAADLEGLSDAQWATPSLCSEWTVKDVLAHMTATAEMTPLKFLPKMLGSGFRLTKLQNKDIARVEAGDVLAQFNAAVNRSTAPPGPVDTWLGETLIHASDIRRPLGIKHDYPTEAAVRVADSYKNSNLVMGAKRRIAGVRLRADDVDWAHGDGPEVTGPMMSLLLVIAGRKDGLTDLSGEGLAALSSRA